jgi:hypothetical protein
MLVEELKKYIAETYNVEPRIVFKVHDIMKNIDGVDIAVLFDAVTKVIKTDPVAPANKYYKNNKILLILDEIDSRLSKLVDNNEKLNQLSRLASGLIGINELDKIKKNTNTYPDIICISCGETLQIDNSTKKYNCSQCFIEFST